MSTPERSASPQPRETPKPSANVASADHVTVTASAPRHEVVPILNAQSCVVTALPGSMSDSMLLRFRDQVLSRLSLGGVHGVVIDVRRVDLLDSFAVRVLNSLAHMASLQHAGVVIAGLRADHALAMSRLGAAFEGVTTTSTVAAGVASLAEGTEPVSRAGA